MQLLSSLPRGGHFRSPSSPWCTRIRPQRVYGGRARDARKTAEPYRCCAYMLYIHGLRHHAFTAQCNGKYDCGRRTALQAEESNRSPCESTILPNQRQELLRASLWRLAERAGLSGVPWLNRRSKAYFGNNFGVEK